MTCCIIISVYLIDAIIVHYIWYFHRYLWCYSMLVRLFDRYRRWGSTDIISKWSLWCRHTKRYMHIVIDLWRWWLYWSFTLWVLSLSIVCCLVLLLIVISRCINVLASIYETCLLFPTTKRIILLILLLWSLILLWWILIWWLLLSHSIVFRLTMIMLVLIVYIMLLLLQLIYNLLYFIDIKPI